MSEVYDIKTVARKLGMYYKTLWATLDDMETNQIEVGFPVGKRRFYTEADIAVIRAYRDGKRTKTAKTDA
jgi:hypothetical protein